MNSTIEMSLDILLWWKIKPKFNNTFWRHFLSLHPRLIAPLHAFLFGSFHNQVQGNMLFVVFAFDSLQLLSIYIYIDR